MQPFNRFTLKPKDAKLNKEFLESRKEDVKDMFSYACFFVALRLAMGVYTTIVRYNLLALVKLTMWSVWALLHVAAYFLGRRFKEKFVLMIVCLYTSTNLFIVFRAEFMSD